jgi:hypothetical protein
VTVPLLKNSRGKPDGLWTLLVIACVLAGIKLLLSGATLTVAGLSLAAGTFDAGAGAGAAAIVAPFLGAYVARKWGDGKPAADKPEAAK